MLPVVIYSNLWFSLFVHEFISYFVNMQALPNFTFANQSGLDMLETTLVALQDITLEKIFDDNGKKTLASEFPRIMQQVWLTIPSSLPNQ